MVIYFICVEVSALLYLLQKYLESLERAHSLNPRTIFHTLMIFLIAFADVQMKKGGARILLIKSFVNYDQCDQIKIAKCL